MKAGTQLPRRSGAASAPTTGRSGLCETQALRGRSEDGEWRGERATYGRRPVRDGQDVMLTPLGCLQAATAESGQSAEIRPDLCVLRASAVQTITLEFHHGDLARQSRNQSEVSAQDANRPENERGYLTTDQTRIAPDGNRGRAIRGISAIRWEKGFGIGGCPRMARMDADIGRMNHRDTEARRSGGG